MAKRRSKGAQRKDAKTQDRSEAPLEKLPPSPWWHWLLPVILILAGTAAFWNGLDTEFLLDDDQHIVRSERIRDLRGNIGEILATNRPLVELSMAVNYHFAELKPRSYHVYNLVIHLLAGLTLFGLVRRTLQLPSLQESYSKGAHWFALAISLFWTLHPIQTESVTYTIQRAESMMGLFYLLIPYCLVRSVRSRHCRWWYAAAAIAGGMGMGSKAIIVTAPAIVLLYDRVFIARSFSELFRRRWGFHACALGGILSIGLVTGVLHYVIRIVGTPEATARFSFRAQVPSDYIATQPSVILHYLKTAFWPAELCLDYRWRPATEALQVILPSLVIFALVGATVYALVKKPPLGFLGAWFFIILSPTSVVWTLELCFEHRMYLSLAALSALVVFAGHHLIKSLSTRSPLLFRILFCLPNHGSLAAVLLVVGIAVALGYRTAERNRDYESRFTMNQAVVRVRPNNDRAHYNLANAWKKKGELHKAIESYKAAISINPRHANAMCNLANRYVDLGQLDVAVEGFYRVLRLNPRHPRALYNLGNALVKYRIELRGQDEIEQAQTRLKEATAVFRRSHRTRPRHVPTLTALAVALHSQRQYDEAEEAIQKVLKIKPDHEWAIKRLQQIRASRDRQ